MYLCQTSNLVQGYIHFLVTNRGIIIKLAIVTRFNAKLQSL
jgi:hypothetical protein